MMEKVCLSTIIQDLKDCSAQADNFINDFNRETETCFSEWFASIKQLALDIKNGVIEEEEEANGRMGNKVPELNTFVDRQQKVVGRFACLMSEMQKGHLHENNVCDNSSKLTNKKTVSESKKNNTSVEVCIKGDIGVHNSPVHQLRNSNGEGNKGDNLNENTKKIENHSHPGNCTLSPLKLRNGKTPRSESKHISADAEKNTKADFCYKTPDMRTAVIDSSTHSISVLKNNPKCKSVLLGKGKQSKRKSSELNKIETKESAKRKKINNSKLPSAKSTGRNCKKIQEQNSVLKTSLCQGTSFLGSHNQNQKSSVSGLTSLLLKPAVHNPKKEVQLLKEIQKKEEKANETLKKVMSLRQMRAEENKRKRQEKMEKNLQQRLKIEKEKEERLRSHKNSVEIISQKGPHIHQLSVKLNGISTTDNQQTDFSKKQVKNQLKSPPRKKANQEDACKPLPLQNSNNALKDHSHVMNKMVTASSNIKGTSVSNSSSNSQTPGLNTTYVADTSEHNTKAEVKKVNETIVVSDSSFVNYEIDKNYVSDDDDDEAEESKKPIPSWAKGIVFKNALLTQHYHPPDLDTLFGVVIDAPDLTEIFGPKKKYKKRTSSAIWNSPNRPCF